MLNATTSLENVLILSAGRRVSLVRAFQKELAEYRPSGRVLCADACPALSSACHVVETSLALPRVNEDDFIDCLFALCSDHGVGIIIPTIDTELLKLANFREQFAEKGFQVVVSAPDLIAACRDKRKTQALFLACGFECPELYDPSTIKFPVFVKPYDGSRSVDAHLVSTPEDLSDHYLSSERYMFQEALNCAEYDEITVDLYFNQTHHLCSVVPRQRLEVRDGEVSKGKTIDEGIVVYFKERLSHLPGARGCVNIQIFRHRQNGSIRAIEMNPRFGGGYPLAYRAGANYPRWILQEYLGGEIIPFCNDWERNLLMLRFDDEVFAHGISS